MESLNSLIPAHFIYGTVHLDVGFLLSYFILAMVLPITKLLMVFIVYIFNFPHFLMIRYICVNGLINTVNPS
jgi:hypothetical protein